MGPLAGLSFAVKDNIAISGSVSGNGNPYWRDQHDIEATTARTVTAILEAGARLVGRTHMDELAYSLMGTNAHYGTPVNPLTPSRVPGGSSSGSAVAVARGDVDFALGTDTGGSVRLPAAFCGIYGLRPTHGLVPVDGVVPLAPSFDTVGWFARDTAVLGSVSRTLIHQESDELNCLWQPLDVWSGVGVWHALVEAVEKLKPHFHHFASDPLPLPDASARSQAFAICQGREIWENLGPWVTQSRSTVAPDIRARLAAAARLTDAEVEEARSVRAAIRSAMNATMAGKVLVLPTAPIVAPLLTSSQDDFLDARQQSIALLSIAGHSGLPQISIPYMQGGLPLGLSLIGPPGSDLGLVRIVEGMMAHA